MATPDYFFDANLVSDDEEVTQAIAELEGIIRSSGLITRWHKRHTDHLKIIVLNLLKIHQLSPESYVKYSRSQEHYYNLKTKAARYFKFTSSLQTTTNLVDALASEQLNLVTHDKGYYFPKQGRMKPSRMRATSKFIDHVREHAAELVNINWHPDTETIILKDTDKKLVDYEDTTATTQMRSNLEQINTVIGSHFIGLCVLDEVLDDINKRLADIEDEDPHDEIPNMVDYKRLNSYRVFNNGSFEQGGRFYGGWWQSVPKEYRRYIRIDNVGTEELDFPGLHINLIYAHEKCSLPTDDVYLVEGLPKEARKFLKVALNVLINAKTLDKGLRAIRRNFPRHKLPPVMQSFKYETIIELFMDKHPPLAKHFGSGFGVKLQYLDSVVAEKAMLALAGRGIPALPIHDSFIVSRHHSDALNVAMNNAIEEVAGIRLNLKASATAYDDVFEHGVAEEVGSIEQYEGPRWTSEKECSQYFERLRGWKEVSQQ